MGQNSCEPIDSKTTLTQQWLPHETDFNVLVNKVTHEQVQRHFVRILVKDLPRQIAHFASRMSNQQPNICRLLYFHPSVPDSRSCKDDKDFRQMHLYTDRMLPLQQWNKDKLIMALQGFHKLLSIHGPFKITERMICEDETNEVKVWISQRPVSNHPDAKYASEEQTVADIAAILTKKNQDLASKLLGCRTLKNIFQKLNQNYRENKSPFNNYSHRASESGDIKLKKYEPLERPANSQHYRNVFDISAQGKPKGNFNLTPTKIKNSDLVPSTYKKNQDQSKPTSNMSQYRDFLYHPTSKCINKEDRIVERAITNANMAKDTSLDFKQTFKEKCPEVKAVERPVQFAHKSQENKTNSSHYFEQKQSSTTPHRFQTSSKLGSPTAFNLASQKGFKATAQQSQEVPSNFSTKANDSSKGNSFYSSSPNIHKIESKRGYDITIINNNVSNYYNNIVHNHLLTLEKKGSDEYLYQTRKTQGQDIYSSHKETSNPDVVVHKPREKSAYVPVFIKKRNCQPAQEPSNKTKIKRETYLARQDTIDSNPSSYFNNEEHSPPPVFEQKIEKKQSPYEPVLNFALRNFQKKGEKTFNFSRNKVSPNKFLTKSPQVSSYYPKTPTPNTSFNGFQSSFTPFLSSNDKTMPLRTKTTEFYRKGGERKDDVIQNKSFTLNQDKQKLKQIEAPKSHKPLEDNFIKNITQFTEPIHFTKESEPEAASPEQKTNLKKQLRQQFKFLLGGDGPASEDPVVEPKLEKSSSARVQIKEEGQVKEKIIKKQIAFAQLKKQALKVLD